MLLLQRGIVRHAMSSRKFTQFIGFIEFIVFFNARNPKNSRNSRNFLLYALCSVLMMLGWGDFGYAQTGIKAKVPDLCYQCHKQLKESLSQSYVHFPFKQGKCEACHNMHASDRKDLLKDDVNSVCLSCHEGIRNLMSKGT